MPDRSYRAAARAAEGDGGQCPSKGCPQLRACSPRRWRSRNWCAVCQAFDLYRLDSSVRTRGRKRAIFGPHPIGLIEDPSLCMPQHDPSRSLRTGPMFRWETLGNAAGKCHRIRGWDGSEGRHSNLYGMYAVVTTGLSAFADAGPGCDFRRSLGAGLPPDAWFLTGIHE